MENYMTAQRKWLLAAAAALTASVAFQAPAVADPDPVDDTGVEVRVDIEPIKELVCSPCRSPPTPSR
jgi:hypothetical protein